MLNLPTDNLYKFICVLGIFIISSCITLLLRATDAMDKDLAEFVSEEPQVRAAYAQYAKTVNDGIAIVNRAGGLNSKGTPEQVEAVRRILTKADPLQEATSQALLKMSLIAERLDRYRTTKILCLTGIGVGGVFFVGGLALWYRRVQRMVDTKGAV